LPLRTVYQEGLVGKRLVVEQRGTVFGGSKAHGRLPALKVDAAAGLAEASTVGDDAGKLVGVEAGVDATVPSGRAGGLGGDAD
jgi:hypothetical protein